MCIGLKLEACYSYRSLWLEGDVLCDVLLLRRRRRRLYILTTVYKPCQQHENRSITSTTATTATKDMAIDKDLVTL